MSPSPIFWQRCIAAFREELTPQQFNTWIRPLAIEGADEGYRLLAPNRFVLQWVKERFVERIAELAAAAEGHTVPITLAVRDAGGEAAPLAEPAPAPAPVASAPTPRRNEQTSLNPTFTFACR
jgi:chromosomal replication initiator protein